MIAESNPNEKDMMVKVIVNLINSNNLSTKKAIIMHCPQKVRHYLGAFLCEKSTQPNLG